MLPVKFARHGYTTAVTPEHIPAQACGLFLEKRHCRGNGLSHYMTLVEAAVLNVTRSRLDSCGPLPNNSYMKTVLARGAVHHCPYAAGLQEAMAVSPVLAASGIPELSAPGGKSSVASSRDVPLLQWRIYNIYWM